MSPEKMDDIFIFYFIEKNIQLFKSFNITKKTCKTVYYGCESFSSLALRIWELMLNSIRTYKLFENLKIKSNHQKQSPEVFCEKGVFENFENLV